VANLYYIDLFCGAGGVSTGIVRAGGKIVMCINHDPLAIASHEANHPNIKHAVEDIRTFDLTELVAEVARIRREDPLAIICLWASLECTHFSRAKGGDHRDADSRTLAEHLFRYIELLSPDYIDIENVTEFMSWGPLRVACAETHGDRSDLKLRSDGSFHMVPQSKKNGEYYTDWFLKICNDYDYVYDFRVLNSADFGAYTARIRYFGQFRKDHLPFTWPSSTHEKTPKGIKQKWKAVKHVLDLEDKGKSIFGRTRKGGNFYNLSENTLKRHYRGAVKYLAGGKEPSIMDNFFAQTDPLLEGGHTVLVPVNTSGNGDSSFLSKYYGTGENNTSLGDPCATLTTKDRMALVSGVWLDKQFRGDDNHQSVETPAGSIMTNDKHCKMTTIWIENHTQENSHYLVNPQFNSKGGSVSDPCFTLIAKMDKRPPYLASAITAEPGYIVMYPGDSSYTRKIKLLMAWLGISDIRMRMLTLPELLKIQGFGAGYKLLGTQADQKKFIGNSVEVTLAREKVKCRREALGKHLKIAV
jgi:DNA (cytosine-5)-methyltransferase 1